MKTKATWVHKGIRIDVKEDGLFYYGFPNFTDSEERTDTLESAKVDIDYLMLTPNEKKLFDFAQKHLPQGELQDALEEIIRNFDYDY